MRTTKAHIDCKVEKVETVEHDGRPDELLMTFTNGWLARWYHKQDCCETVDIEDITGDPNDLVDSPLIMAEVVSNKTDDGLSDSRTWTFYKFATVRGYVIVRWLGRSNDYYSERVDFELSKCNKF